MPNFSIATQIKKEREQFKQRVRLTQPARENEEAVRYASSKKWGYDYNQRETINLIDLYYNSQFESGPYDNVNQRKMFLNVGKFRSDVASKQIQIATKDGKFYPDGTADPYVAFFMQKDFHEWAKDTNFADLINLWEDKLPKYGTIVGKQVGNDIVDLPLQNIEAMDQTAESIQTATHFIEAHPKMRSWEIQAMDGWVTEGFSLRYDEEYDVYERSGWVPKAWLLRQNGVDDPQVLKDAGEDYVDAKVIGAWPKNDTKKDFHVFFAEQVTDRGYREKHWARLAGRWLGVGVIEDLFENQRSKNVIVNLLRKALQWGSKRIFQSGNTDLAAKNLVRDVPDGAIMDVGANGQVTEVVLNAKMNADFSAFLTEWERNSDQKAFTYEVATGANPGAGTTATVGVILSKAVASYYGKKKEAFGLFLKQIVVDFKVPQFIKDMDNEERVLTLFPDEAGSAFLREAAMQFVRSTAATASLLSGKPVDVNTISQAIEPYMAAHALFFNKKKGVYKKAKTRFDFEFVDESVGIGDKLQSLQTLFQVLSAKGDPRADAVLDRIAALSGESLASFGPKPTKAALPPANPNAPSTPTVPAAPVQRTPAGVGA